MYRLKHSECNSPFVRITTQCVPPYFEDGPRCLMLYTRRADRLTRDFSDRTRTVWRRYSQCHQLSYP